jgi:hypothetical protein
VKLNKRQKKKNWKKKTPKEYQVCICGEKLDCFNKYHMKYGTCNSYCYARMVCADGYY